MGKLNSVMGLIMDSKIDKEFYKWVFNDDSSLGVHKSKVKDLIVEYDPVPERFQDYIISYTHTTTHNIF